MMPPPTEVIGISGSLRAGSYTTMAVATALNGSEEVGATIQLVDLRDYNLTLSIGSNDASSYPESVAALRQLVHSADGIILGTPEYHGSFSGVLKNALDLMGFDEFEGKMIGLVGVSGGQMGAFDALNSLRNIGRALHAWVVPEQASVPEAWKVFGSDGLVKDDLLKERLKTVGRQVARFAALHRSQQHPDFLKAWEKAPKNPGG
jgi:FMN reductase